MQACEKKGLNKAASQFAHAAIAELPTAFAHTEDGAAERDQHAGRIWTNLFAFALDKSDHEVGGLLVYKCLLSSNKTIDIWLSASAASDSISKSALAPFSAPFAAKDLVISSGNSLTM